MIDREKVIKGLEECLDVLANHVPERFLGGSAGACIDAIALLKAQEQRKRLEVHNIGNVDIPEGVTDEQYHAVMNNVVAALEHTDRGESWPYEDDAHEGH